MHGKNVRRMDESISILMKLIFNMKFERVIRLEKGYLAPKLTKLRQRHKDAVSANFQFAPDPDDKNKFSIVSSQGDDIYTVCFYQKMRHVVVLMFVKFVKSVYKLFAAIAMILQ